MDVCFGLALDLVLDSWRAAQAKIEADSQLQGLAPKLVEVWKEVDRLNGDDLVPHSMLGERRGSHFKFRTGVHNAWRKLRDDVDKAGGEGLRGVLRSTIADWGSQIKTRLASLSEAHRSLNFFKNVIRAAKGDTKEIECSVCMREGFDVAQLGVTPCGHIFCVDCLKLQVQLQKICSICRSPLAKKDIHQYGLKSRPTQQARNQRQQGVTTCPQSINASWKTTDPSLRTSSSRGSPTYSMYMYKIIYIYIYSMNMYKIIR